MISGASPSDGSRIRFIQGEAVRLDADLLSVDLGAEGSVTWVILGPPIFYLVEFRVAGGGTRPQMKVE